MGSNSERPSVTVLMPVYNGGRYLREAMKSILAQSFADFELLIIDDGSTDDSVAIVNSFADPRIRLVRNEQNLGVARTLNKGIDEAKGEFIARMDADDISLPHRLESQLEQFSISPGAAVVASKVVLIDAAGNDAGIWDSDCSAITCEQIYRHLPRANCLAHPTVIVRKEVIARYRYHDTKIHAEDYDLWLRLAADGIRIEKVEERLLKYRIHSASVTAFSNAASFGVKDISAKAKYLLHRLGKRKWLNQFDIRVAGYLALDAGKFTIARINMKLRYLVKQLLLTLGRLFSLSATRQLKSQLFFFFPFYHTGGAERVHANIVAAVAEQKPWVIITHPSNGNHFRELFSKNGHLLEVSSLLKNAIIRIICLGYFSALINRMERARVLGANTPFFYELLPYLEDNVECIDLIHAFGGGLEQVSLPYVARLNHRVVINPKTLDDLRAQYGMNGVGEEKLDRISIIENAVSLPADFQRKVGGERLNVLYVGRGAVEKRVHLVGEVARLCLERDLPVDFTLVGDVFDSMPMHCRKYCTMVGGITEDAELERHYREHDVLLVTSRSEGFPMVIIEAMAHGVVPVSTDVGGISAHVIDGITGFLISSGEREEEITSAFVDLLSRLAKNRSLLEEMSERTFRHAAEHFGFERFNRAYRQLLSGSQVRVTA